MSSRKSGWRKCRCTNCGMVESSRFWPFSFCTRIQCRPIEKCCRNCRKTPFWSTKSILLLIIRSSKHPIGSMTSTEEDRNQYLAAKYKERIEAMLDRQQVILHVLVGLKNRLFQVDCLRMKRCSEWIVWLCVFLLELVSCRARCWWIPQSMNSNRLFGSMLRFTYTKETIRGLGNQELIVGITFTFLTCLKKISYQAFFIPA